MDRQEDCSLERRGQGGPKRVSKKVYVKPYPKEFREQVVQLVQLGDRSALEVAREFEISVDSVRRWVQHVAGARPGPPVKTA